MSIALPGFRLDWTTPHGELMALEPRLDEVAQHVTALAAAYNDPHNAPLLGHQAAIAESEVLDHYEALANQGAHAFLLFLDGALAGDGDVRGIDDGAAEFAFMIASPSSQGKGLGTRFATMIHAFAFQQLAITRMYASIVPTNTASRRVFEKLGYVLDTSTEGRSFADEIGDITMAIDRATFEERNVDAFAQIRIGIR